MTISRIVLILIGFALISSCASLDKGDKSLKKTTEGLKEITTTKEEKRSDWKDVPDCQRTLQLIKLMGGKSDFEQLDKIMSDYQEYCIYIVFR